MIAYFLLLAVRQSDLSSDLNSAVQRVKIGSPDFKKSISKVLEKYDIAGGKFMVGKVGDPGGRQGRCERNAGAGTNDGDGGCDAVLHGFLLEMRAV